MKKEEIHINTKKVLASIKIVSNGGVNSVDLSNRKLTTPQLRIIIGELAKVSNLTSLDLSNNDLDEIPAEISQLKQLRVLNLAANNLSQLPDELFDIPELINIKLEDNNLSSIPYTIKKLDYPNIYLNNNPITQEAIIFLEATFGESKGNFWLYHDEPTVDLPDNLKEALASVESFSKEEGDVIDLSHKELTTIQLAIVIQEIIKKCYNVREINLSHNNIVILPVEIGDLFQLRRINLSSNYLSVLPNELFEILNITEINLDHNNITTLTDESIEEIDKINKLYLRGNPISSEIIKTLENIYGKGDWLQYDLSSERKTLVSEQKVPAINKAAEEFGVSNLDDESVEETKNEDKQIKKEQSLIVSQLNQLKQSSNERRDIKRRNSGSSSGSNESKRFKSTAL